jgi:hypothetical protein
MRPRVAIVVLTLLVAGCSGDSTEVAENALPTVVLQPADLPSAFERFDEGRQVRADQPEGREDAARFGRVSGWKSRYRRRGGAETPGPLVVESRADLFKSGGGAEDELDAIASEGGRDLADEGLGEEAVVVTRTQQAFPRPLVTYVVSWRSDNVVAAITANGFQGRMSERDALRLARLQQARIAAVTH